MARGIGMGKVFQPEKTEFLCGVRWGDCAWYPQNLQVVSEATGSSAKGNVRARLKGCTGSSKQLVQVFKDRFPGPSLVPQQVWENLG